VQPVALLFFAGWRNACVDGVFDGIWDALFCELWSDFAATMVQWVALLFLRVVRCGALIFSTKGAKDGERRE